MAHQVHPEANPPYNPNAAYQQGTPPPYHGAGQYDNSGYAAPGGGAGGYAPVTPVADYKGADQTPRFNYAEGEWRDKPWLVLFVLHLAAMVVFAVIWGPQLMRAMQDGETGEVGGINEQQVIGGIVIAAVAATFFGIFWLSIMKKCAGTIIKISIFVNVAIMAIAAAVALYFGIIVMALIWLLFAGLLCLYFWWVRNRIAFAQAVIKASVTSVQQHSGTVYTSYSLALVQIVWLAFWVFTTAAIYWETAKSDGQDPTDPDSVSPLGGVVTFLLLISLFWTSQVLKNIGHVTTAGSVASWWLAPQTKNPTCGALKRACTTSLGSICFGSLIVAVLKAIRVMLRSARDSARNSNNSAAMCVLCCVDCVLQCIERMVEFFNMYAYTQVAIYGKSFIQAAKDTWALLRAKGFELIINNDLTGMVLGMGCLLGGVVGATTGGFWAFSVGHADDGTTWIVVATVGFILGLITVSLIMAVVESAVATTYVVWAEDPATMGQQRPEQFADMREAAAKIYPDWVNSGRHPDV